MRRALQRLRRAQWSPRGVRRPDGLPADDAPDRIVWFELPVADLDRAIRFYAAVLGRPVAREDLAGQAIATLPRGDGGICGCLVPGATPAVDGPLFPLDVAGRLDTAIAAAIANGGTVVQPPDGRQAIVVDSEGNRVALQGCAAAPVGAPALAARFRR